MSTLYQLCGDSRLFKQFLRTRESLRTARVKFVMYECDTLSESLAKHIVENIHEEAF